MQNNMKQPSRTSTDTSPMEELRRLPQSTRSEPSQEKAKDLGPEPKPGVRVRYVGKCGTSHPPRECPAWGKKCHKCGNKNHFSMQCRSRQSGGSDRRSRSTSRGCKNKGKRQQSRSRSNQVTKSAHSIESTSFQDHSGNLHGDSADLHGQQTRDLHGASGSTEFLKQSFSTICRSKSVSQYQQ